MLFGYSGLESGASDGGGDITGGRAGAWGNVSAGDGLNRLGLMVKII
jgi:hypothetical protein